MSLSRPTALSIVGKFVCTTGICAGVIAVSAAQALAAPAPPPPPAVAVAPAPVVVAAAPAVASTPVPAVAPVVQAAPANVSAALAVCPGQTFSQPFEALKDFNYYTLVEGSEFNSANEGWELGNGASIVEGTRPGGGSGNVLDLPAGAYAVSPPVCVTLQYPTARAYIEDVRGGGGVTVGVYYPGGKPAGQVAGQLNAKKGGGWELSNPFNVQPQLGGNEEGVREVRFIFANTSKGGDYHLSGLYVDPRMS